MLAGVAELADALDLGSSGRPCRFDSCHPHSKKGIALSSLEVRRRGFFHVVQIRRNENGKCV